MRVTLTRGRREAGDRVIRDDIGHVVRRVQTVGPVPLRRPVERTEKRARRDRRVGRAQLAALDPVGDEDPHAALVAIALVDDERAEAAGEGIDLEMGCGALDFVDEAEDVRRCEMAQSDGRGSAVAPRVAQRREQAIERPVLTEEQQLVLPAEVVIQVAGREVGGNRDVAHAGRGEPALPEDPRRRLEDLDAPRFGAM